MKGRILILLSILMTVPSYGGGNEKKENNSHQKIKFGAEAGINFPRLIYQQEAANTASLFSLAWHLGGCAEIIMSNKFTFQPELLYSIKGNRVQSFLSSGGYLTYNLDYVEIPLQLKYRITEHFNLIGGLYAGYLVAFSSNVTNTQYSNSPNVSYYDSFNKLDIGAIIGIGYQLTNGFNFAIKYSRGFSDIVSTQDSNGNPIVPEYNMVISICAGWTLK